MTTARRKARPGVPRSEMMGLRLEPRLKYMAELAARKQRRPLSNFMEWALEEALRRTSLSDAAGAPSTWEASIELWDQRPAHRFVLLVEKHPELLSYEEQQLLSLFRRSKVIGSNNQRIGFVDDKERLDVSAVETCWDEANAYIEGRISQDQFEQSMGGIEVVNSFEVIIPNLRHPE